MPVIHDEEFGKITIRRSVNARQIRVRVAPNGTLRASLPMYAPIFLVKRLLKNSRSEIREILAKSKPEYTYTNGMQIGKSHTLVVENSDNHNFSVTRRGLKIFVKVPTSIPLSNATLARQIRDAIIAALRIEAKSYLPKRLSYLADKYGFKYQKIRFSHAGSRWGSCSSSGTISLNIALMKLPFELIDYVLIHELAHTKKMDHSKEFWHIVSLVDPDFKRHKSELKLQNPTI